MSEHLYPLLFEPNLHPVVWGGKRLRPYKNLPSTDEPIGESWEISAVPSSVSVISNGMHKGRLLTDVIEEYPQDILGKSIAKKYGNKLPLLAKFIDASNDLSIQVHPNDAMAQREHGKNGKTEMWYIIDAAPDSRLLSGFSKEITPEEYQQRIADNTITEVLASHKVNAGDVFYIPAGRVHAIGSGILLAEIQQSSDVTYRIYDYNRPGMDGKPRELHTELAAKAINYNIPSRYRTDYTIKGDSASLVVNTSFFNVKISTVTSTLRRKLKKYDSFIITMCIQGACTIRIRKTGQTLTLHEGHSCLIPAALADYDVTSLNTGISAINKDKDAEGMGNVTRLLDAYIDGRPISQFNRLYHKIFG